MPDQQDESRGVVVTGASTGIGRATALRLDRLGFQVFAGVRKEADGQSLKAEASGRLSPLMLDVTDESSIASAANAVSKVVGERGLAGLVNNAGITVPGPIEFLPIEDVRRQIDVNVIGQIAVTQAFLLMIRQGRGRIVNIGSPAISPQRLTPTPCRWPARMICLISPRTAGLAAVNSDATFSLPRSTARVY